MSLWGRWREIRIPKRVLALSGLLLSAIGSCTMPQIKPPGLP